MTKTDIVRGIDWQYLTEIVTMMNGWITKKKLNGEELIKIEGLTASIYIIRQKKKKKNPNQK